MEVYAAHRNSEGIGYVVCLFLIFAMPVAPAVGALLLDTLLGAIILGEDESVFREAPSLFSGNDGDSSWLTMFGAGTMGSMFFVALVHLHRGTINANLEQFRIWLYSFPFVILVAAPLAGAWHWRMVKYFIPFFVAAILGEVFGVSPEWALLPGIVHSIIHLVRAHSAINIPPLLTVIVFSCAAVPGFWLLITEPLGEMGSFFVAGAIYCVYFAVLWTIRIKDGRDDEEI